MISHTYLPLINDYLLIIVLITRLKALIFNICNIYILTDVVTLIINYLFTLFSEQDLFLIKKDTIFIYYSKFIIRVVATKLYFGSRSYVYNILIVSESYLLKIATKSHNNGHRNMFNVVSSDCLYLY